jgi:hypothetical protein
MQFTPGPGEAASELFPQVRSPFQLTWAVANSALNIHTNH